MGPIEAIWKAPMGLQSHMTMLEDLKRAAWGRTSPVSGHGDAWEFRKDCLGNLVRYADFGNRHSPFGWELDFIVPRTLGGSSAPENLQVLNWKAGAARKESLPAGLMSRTNVAAANY